MQVVINTANDISISSTTRSAFEGDIQDRLQRHAASVLSVTVFVSDQNGQDKGGDDKSVRLVAEVPHVGQVVTEETAGSIGLALDVAIGELSRILDKTFERMRDRSRHAPRVEPQPEALI